MKKHISRMTINIIMCVVTATATMTASPDAKADTDLLAECRNQEKPIINVGAPHSYRRTFDEMINTEQDVAPQIANWAVCPAFAYGNDYQVLDWLENGQLDAAIMSEFAAAVLDSGQVGRTTKLYHIAKQLPFPDGELATYDIRLTLSDQSIDSENVAAEVSAMLSLIANGTLAMDQKIVIDSHLSPAFPVLLQYVSEQMAGAELMSDTIKHDFWNAFLETLEFRIASNSGVSKPGFASVHASLDPAAQGTILTDPGTTFQDVFVYDARLGDSLFGSRVDDGRTSFLMNEIEDWLAGSNKAIGSAGNGAIADYLDRNFGIHETGFRQQRFFRFNLDELWRVLHEVDNESSALVLTGGGVKAAYQTTLIDHLYGESLLANKTDEEPANDNVVPVDYIIGTSGGALLGIFVSAIEYSTDLDLTARIWWKPDPGRYMESYDVFPVIEMPRYFTLIVAALILTLFLFLVRRFKWGRKMTAIQTIDTSILDHGKTVQPFQPRLIWLLFLMTMPLVIKKVTGIEGLQHVPAITGIFYFLIALIAAYSDNRIIFNSSFSIRNLEFKDMDLVALIGGLLLITTSLVSVALNEASDDSVPLLGTIGLASLVCCIGFSTLAIVLHRAFVKQSDHLQLVPRAYIGKGFLVLVTVPVLAYAGLMLTNSSLFELTVVFWKNFLLWSAGASLLVLALGYAKFWPKEKNFLRHGIDFLVSDPSTRTYFRRSKRYTQVILYFIGVFFWWNLIMAPGIYGNEQARRYFEGLYKDEICLQNNLDDAACKELDLANVESIQPVTPFVISATSLEKQKERYFILHPDAYKRECQSGKSLDERGVIYRLLKTDPRWETMDCHPSSQSVINKAFASGSPFPVFPATLVSIASADPEEAENDEIGKNMEWLVDGGYAHNIPIEAANALGAETILVISSSPLHQAVVKKDGIMRNVLGNLSRNLTRLFPYLFERSQVEDAVRAQQSLVITLSPAGNTDNWPGLTDFRGVTVKNMIEHAQEDIFRRIGTVESWGPPDCTIAGVTYRCNAINGIRRNPDR